MKRLLCILSNMNAGGAETFLMKVYRNIDKSKYQFDFCVNVQERCYYENEIENLGGKLYRIPSKSDDLKAFKKKLTNIIKENDYQYVLRITANAAGLLDLKVAKKAGAQRCIARSSNSNSEGSIKNKIAHILGKELYLKYVDVGIAPSNLAAEYTFGKKMVEKGKILIVHNALDIDVYKFNKNGRIKIRNEFGIKNDFIVIGNVGRFMTQKNHKRIIEIFEEIHLMNSKTVLMLVGNGELEKEIKKDISEKGLQESVVFTGVRSDIPDLLSAMDVMLMPSFYEGMPNTVIEAQATGLPCVISDTITREANITGLVKYISLLDQNNVWAKEVLSTYINNRIETKHMFIENSYNISAVVKQFENIVFGE